MDFIPLSEILESIAGVKLENVLKERQSEDPSADFWKREAPWIDYEYRISEAARRLNEALHHAVDPPRWARWDTVRKFAVPDADACTQGDYVLTEVTGWAERRAERRSAHAYAYTNRGLDPDPDMVRDLVRDEPVRERLGFLWLSSLYLERVSLAALLSNARIEHDLSLIEEALDSELTKAARQQRAFARWLKSHGYTIDTMIPESRSDVWGQLSEIDPETFKYHSEDVMKKVYKTLGAKFKRGPKAL